MSKIKVVRNIKGNKQLEENNLNKEVIFTNINWIS
jgi:hypothetical protein